MFYPMFLHGGKHLGYLMSFIGKNVKINRGGPESIVGKLIAVHADYIVLRTNNGFIYVNAAHIKSITEGKGSHSVGRSMGRPAGYIMAYSFNDVLRRLQKQFVQINQGGPEKVTGFIVEVGPDTLLLVSGKEVIRIPLFHIRTVSPVQRGGSSDDQSRDSGQGSQSQRSGGRNGSGDSKSQGRNQQRSQGQRSGDAQRAGGSQGRRQDGGSRGHHGSRGAGATGGRKR